MGAPIYVEVPIRAPLEELWRHTQSPDLHQRWDLRFTRIAYLPRPDPVSPQRFLYAKRRGCIVDYLGTHQHLAVDIHLSVDERGGLCLRSGEQRFYEGLVAFRFPLLFSGVADVREWFDDAAGRFRIEVTVTNRTWGRLFGYRGWFTAEWPACPAGAVPPHVRPLREESRE